MLGTLVGILFALVLAAAVIFIVSRLNLGLTVDSFMTAIIAAAVITIIGGVIAWLLGALGITIGGGFFGALVNLIVAALVLMLGARFVKGMTVNGFTGALVAAIAIGVVTCWPTGCWGCSVWHNPTLSSPRLATTPLHDAAALFFCGTQRNRFFNVCFRTSGNT